MAAMEPNVEELLAKIIEKPKYEHIHEGLVRALIQNELSKQRSKKETLKAVSRKLHQIGAGYFTQKPDYAAWAEQLRHIPRDIYSQEARQFCLQAMKHHSSTRERLPILASFFIETLASASPIESILDLACGLNPLAIAWMPGAKDIRYYGCDIFGDMCDFLNLFFKHMNLSGHFYACDLREAHYPHSAKVAFLLKSLPCLTQLEKGLGEKILENVPAEYVLVSYPMRSLGGRAKGMGKTYENQFNEMAAARGWSFERFAFKNELAFLIKK